jgi:hypothetical protein
MGERLSGGKDPRNPEEAQLNEDPGSDRAEPAKLGEILPPPINDAEKVDSLTEAQPGDLIIVRLTDTGDGVNSGVVHAICQFDYRTTRGTSRIYYLGKINPDTDQENEMAMPTIDTNVLVTAFGYPAETGTIGRSSIFERNDSIILGRGHFGLQTDINQDSEGNGIAGIYRSEAYRRFYDARTLAVGVSGEPAWITNEQWADALVRVVPYVGEHEVDKYDREVLTLPGDCVITMEVPEDPPTNELGLLEPKYIAAFSATYPDGNGTIQESVVSLAPDKRYPDTSVYTGLLSRGLVLARPSSTAYAHEIRHFRDRWTGRIRSRFEDGDKLSYATSIIGTNVAHAFMRQVKEAQERTA